MLHRAVVTITHGSLGLLSSCARPREGTSAVTRPPRLMILGMRAPDPKAGERVATLLRRDLGGRVPRAKLHIVPWSDIWNAFPPGLYDTLSLSDLGQLARIVSARAAVALSVDSSSAGVVLHSLLLRVERTSMQVDTLDSVVATDEGKAARALGARLASDPRLLGLPRAR
jgi:hypothetical protein